jgi:hypothetical protein
MNEFAGTGRAVDLEPWLAAARGFFQHLDEWTHPNLRASWPATNAADAEGDLRLREVAVSRIGALLDGRVLRRAAWLRRKGSLDGYVYDMDRIASGTDIPLLHALARLVERLAVAAFVPPSLPAEVLDARAVRDGLPRIGRPVLDHAFARFVAGDLRLTTEPGPCNGIPDSARYFAFAELAIAVLRAGDVLDEGRSEIHDFWLNYARASVAAQPDYSARYRDPAIARPRFTDYACRHFRANVDVAPVRVVATLPEIELLAARHALAAFPGDFAP